MKASEKSIKSIWICLTPKSLQLFYFSTTIPSSTRVRIQSHSSSPSCAIQPVIKFSRHKDFTKRERSTPAALTPIKPTKRDLLVTYTGLLFAKTISVVHFGRSGMSYWSKPLAKSPSV